MRKERWADRHTFAIVFWVLVFACIVLPIGGEAITDALGWP